MIYLNYCADKASVSIWSAYAPTYKEHSLSITILRCVHAVAIGVFGLCTLGIPHALAFCWIAHRIQATDLAQSPLRNATFLRVAMFLHSEICEDFARQPHPQPLSQVKNAILMKILTPPDSRYHLVQLTNSFLDQTDGRSCFEKYQSYVREYAPYFEEEIYFEEALQRFSGTLLPSLMPHIYAHDAHPLFKRNPNGYHLAFERDTIPSSDNLQLCREMGTLLGAWVSDAQLAKYHLGWFLSPDVYKGLIWFLESSSQELNLPFAQLLARRQIAPFPLSQSAPLQEMARAFQAVYKGGIDQFLRGDLQSECLLATLLQGRVCGAENAFKLIEIAEETENISPEMQENCRTIRQSFQSDPKTIRPFLVILNEVGLEEVGENQGPIHLPYGMKTGLIHAIQRYARVLPAPLVPEAPPAPPFGEIVLVPAG